MKVEYAVFFSVLFFLSNSALANLNGDSINSSVDGAMCTGDSVKDYFFIKINDDDFKINVARLKGVNHSGLITASAVFNDKDKNKILGVIKTYNIFSLFDRERYGCESSPLKLSALDVSNINVGHLIYTSTKRKKVDIDVGFVYGDFSVESFTQDYHGYCKAIISNIVLEEGGFMGCFRKSENESIEAGYFYIPTKYYSPDGISVLRGLCRPKIRDGSICNVTYKDNSMVVRYSIEFYDDLPKDIVEIDKVVRDKIIIEPID